MTAVTEAHEIEPSEAEKPEEAEAGASAPSADRGSSQGCFRRRRRGYGPIRRRLLRNAGRQPARYIDARPGRRAGPAGGR